MTDQDRGAYTPPTDAPLSFDARHPVRGSRPAPFTLIASGFVLILLVAAIVLFYRTGVRQAGQAPATVGAPVGPLRAEAPPEQQPADPAAGLQIYKEESGAPSTAAPTFTPPPEQPAPRPAPTTPVQTAQLPPAAPAAGGLKPAPPIEPPPRPVAAAPKTPPAATPAAPVAAPASGTYAVQIGAFSSQALADKGYVDAGRIAGVDIAGKAKRVEPLEKNGSTLYRTSVTGFASRAQADAFCAQLKSAGKSCFVK